MERIENKINKKYLYGYVFAIVLGSFQFGFSLSSFNPIMRIIVKIYKWEDETQIALYSGLISTIIPFGGFIGSSFVGFFAERERRKLVYFYNFLIILGSLILQIENIYALVAGRLFQGFGIGVAAMISPKIIREISPKQIAGLLGTLHQFMLATGIVFPMILTLGMPHSNEGIEKNQIWRAIFLFPTLISCIQLTLFFSIYSLDTPYFYMIKEDKINLSKSMKCIYWDKDERDSALMDLQKLIGSSGKSKNIKLIDLLGKEFIKPLIVGVTLNFFQQASGINVITFYSSIIFSDHGKHNPAIPNLIFTSLKALAVLIAFFTIEKLGRTRITFLGSIFLGSFLVLIGVSFNLSLFIINVIVITFFGLSYAFSFGPITWIYCAEILPPIGLSVTMSVNLICVCFIVFFTPILLNILHQYFFYIFTFFMLCAAIFSIYFMPETKGLSDLEIKRLFAGSEMSLEKEEDEI